MDDLDLGWLGDGIRPTRSIAEIWATVEIERALRDLGLAADLAGEAVDDPLLGAWVVVVADAERIVEEGAAAGAERIALAEPATEGRLAAFLARNGEGPAGRYVGVPLAIDIVAARGAGAGVALSRSGIGPFGRQIQIVDRSIGGPADEQRGGQQGGQSGGRFLILVEVAAVPSRP
jgi:hypothetical protein